MSNQPAKPAKKTKQEVLKIDGTLVTVNQFYQLVIELSDPTDITTFFETNFPDQKTPLYINEDHTYVKVKIPNWNRNNRQMCFFASKTGEKVQIIAQVKPYNFQDKESEEVIQGACLQLTHFKA